MSRLVEVDTLKEEFRKDIMGGLNWESIIDRCPTVEPPSDSCVKVTFSEEQLNEIVVRVTEKVMTERLLRDV